MTISENTERAHALGQTWEQFRQVNDARLGEIERKGSADPLYDEHLARINATLDNQKQRVDVIETAMARPGKEATLFKASDVQGGEYSKVFCTYLRKGMDAGLERMESKSLSVGSDPDGGYLVTSAMSQQIVQLVHESSPLRSIARVETISTDSLDVIDDQDEAESGWTTETGAVDDTDTPQFGKRSIPVHELYAQPKATQKLVDDAAINIEAWLKVADTFSRKESTAFISGTGSGQPKGILTYADGTDWAEIEQIHSGSAGAVTADGLIKVYYALKEQYAQRATFLINRAVIQSIRLLKDTTGQYIWQPGLAAGAPDTLLGVPVKMAADMPVAAANSLSVAVADFQSAYLIVDRMGIRTLRDPFTDKPFIKFYTTKRVGGDVVNFEAIKLLKLAA